ncbi:MAG: winged helix-turn-helix domain-containing protein [Candidatus Sulfotelmatobacter sp.]
MPSCIYKFGDFELDPSRFELKRNGRSQKLERIPMELLILLAEKEGNVTTRQEIVERLWGKDVFVDTDHGINTAIRKIRQALRDDPEKPRFIQTVTGKGYRFVAEKAEDRQMPGRVTGMADAPRTQARSKEWAMDQVADEVSARSSSPISPALRVISGPRRWGFTMPLVVFLCVAGLLALNAGGVRDRIFPRNRASQIHSIAVLPLANLSGDSAQDYFVDGMTDELITALAKNRSLQVVSRTSAMQYKGVQRPVRDIARELGVDGVLEGSVSRNANRVHMTVQLIYAPTDSHVWAESYDRDLNQAISLPEELSQTVAKEVKTATSHAAPPRPISPEAHDAYLRGRYFWFTHNVPQTLPYFEKAIQLQPDYAAAWAGLSDTYALRSVMGDVPPQESLAKAGDAARKAVELDDSLAEAHLSMAGWYMWSWNPLQADSEARRAIELNPNYAESHFFRHLILLALNRREEALQEEKRAVELDPFARHYGLGACYIDLRQFDAAIDELRMQSQLYPDDAAVHWTLWRAYWFKGMYNESQQELEKELQLSGRAEDAAAAHRVFERGGEKAVEQWRANAIKARARKQYVSPYEIADAVSYSGDKDETLKYLGAAYREHAPDLVAVQSDAAFYFLRDDPRYRALVKQIGLQPAD